MKAIFKAFSKKEFALDSLLAATSFTTAKQIYFSNNEQDDEFKLNFLDISTKFTDNEHNFLAEVTSSIKYKELQPIFKLVLLEILNKLDLQVDSIINKIANDCCSSVFLKSLDSELLLHILVNFENLFELKFDQAEAVFEYVEYELARRLMKKDIFPLDLLVEFHFIFSKNVEGSKPLFDLLEKEIVNKQLMLNREMTDKLAFGMLLFRRSEDKFVKFIKSQLSADNRGDVYDLEYFIKRV